MEKKFYAHIKKNENGQKEYQTVKEHCENSAIIAKQILQTIELGEIGYLSGILHDMGKLKEEFQTYLNDSVNGLQTQRGSVVHTFTGAKFVLDNYHTNLETKRSVLAETIAIAIASHHGLFDIEFSDKENGFDHRIISDDGYEECLNNFVNEVIPTDEINNIMNKAEREFERIIEMIKILASKKTECENQYKEMCFFMSLLDRIILSALMEGDRFDTARFMQPDLLQNKQRVEWETLCQRVDLKILALPQDTEIDVARRKISDICAKRGTESRGVYRLNVPTGGGKTLSSLRFSLHHAKAHNMKRIIFCTPLLSILEQNAAVIREYIDDESLILEHHSNIINDNNDSETIAQNELLIDNWESPIIITTLVQLLNTMFSGKTSSIRRYHSLIDSIIVIDEVQTVPTKMLSLFNLSISFLSGVCGATVVLSSATQPSLRKTEHPIVADINEMVPYDENIWNLFKRTEIKEGEKLTIEELPDFVIKNLCGRKSLLIVCNKKELPV